LIDLKVIQKHGIENAFGLADAEELQEESGAKKKCWVPSLVTHFEFTKRSLPSPPA
jgi:hypothetical protein